MVSKLLSRNISKKHHIFRTPRSFWGKMMFYKVVERKILYKIVIDRIFEKSLWDPEK
jgi:hypothetical protein